MTQFRIITDGQVFRVQYKYRYWPFWFYACAPNEGGETLLEWESKEEAQKYVDKSVHVRVRTWQVVKL